MRYFSACLFLLLVLNTQRLFACIGSISSSEYDALQSLFQSTGGIWWNWDTLQPINTRWTFPSSINDPCSIPWQGISCFPSKGVGEDCVISQISLPQYNMTGQLPPEMGNFSQLSNIAFEFNYISGTMPSELGKLTSLVNIALDKNMLHGPIPSQLGSLQLLNTLSLYYNKLSGSIPSELGHLESCQYLLLYNNSLTGTIPTELGNMQNLTYLYIQINAMNGTIPSELGTIERLENIYMYSNFLSGTIPAAFGYLPFLINLGLELNFLTGTIPSSLGVPTLMEYLILNSNFLTGTIPTELGQLTGLVELELDSNSLTGTIPISLSNLIVIFQDLYLFSNYLSGTLPEELGKCKNLLKLVLSNNYFSGTIPSSLVQFSKLADLDLHSNYFIGSIASKFLLPSLLDLVLSDNSLTGTLPETLFRSPVLNILNLSTNLFSGSLSSVVGNISALSTLDLSSNLFTGRIPSELGQLTHLQSAILSSNYFSGTIFNELGNCQKLNAFGASGNYLSGSIPSSIGNIRMLQLLNLSSNLLSGSMNGLFSNTYGNLSLLDLSQNGLSGLLPSTIFTYQPRLLDVLLYSNCFSGSIPDNVCDAASLQVLVLDGASSSTACDVQLPPGIRDMFAVVLSKNTLIGTIPECIWSMSTLFTFHASGNGLTGTLGDIMDPKSVLSDISLSSNQLRGTIPDSWQTAGHFVNLDLSSNKFSGSLSGSFQLGTNLTLDLTVNRLSGSIPQQFDQVVGVNILNGNLFSCHANSKPQSDPDRSEYVCGSDNLNDALILAVCCFGLGIGLVVYRWFMDPIFKPLWNLNLGNSISVIISLFPSTAEITNLLSRLNLHAFIMTAISCFYLSIVLLFYIVLKLVPSVRSLYSTHSYQYMWTASGAYLHGIVPAVGVSIFLGITCFIFSCYNHPTSTYDISTQDTQSRKAFQGLSTFLLVLLTCTVMICVNVFYVYAIFIGIGTRELILLQIGLSVFKLSWNNIFIKQSLDMLKLNTGVKSVCAVFLVVFTFLISPVLATLFTDSSCLRFIITGVPAVSSSFNVAQYVCELSCAANVLVCTENCGVSTADLLPVISSVIPSWSYSYQCTSAILSNYIPVLIIVQVLTGMVFPLLKVLCIKFPKHWIRLYCPVYVQKKLAGSLLAPCSEMLKLNPNALGMNSIISKYYLSIAMMLTYGLASPLLGCLIALDCWTNSLLMNSLLSRYVTLWSRVSQSQCEHVCRILECECRQFEASIGNNMMLVIVFAGLFWGVFVFDIVGDVDGVAVGGFMMLLPVLLSFGVALGGSINVCKWKPIKDDGIINGESVVESPYKHMNSDLE